VINRFLSKDESNWKEGGYLEEEKEVTSTLLPLFLPLNNHPLSNLIHL